MKNKISSSSLGFLADLEITHSSSLQLGAILLSLIYLIALAIIFILQRQSSTSLLSQKA
jgi:hypothetical protein